MMELSDFENILFKNIFHFIREGSKYSQKFKFDSYYQIPPQKKKQKEFLTLG